MSHDSERRHSTSWRETFWRQSRAKEMTMTKLQSFWGKVLATTVLAGVVVMRADALAPQPGTAMLLAAGLMGASGSTVGPDRALYVTEGILGRISRIDPETGVVTPFASGLPPSIVGFGGAIDLAFVGNTAYVLVTLVGSDVGGSSVVGLYRVDGPVGTTPVADIGAFAIANPPTTAFDVPTGLQFALDNYRNGYRGASRRARWSNQRLPAVRQHRPHRFGRRGRPGVHGRGRPGAAPRTGRQSRAHAATLR
jgi:hypothetical protein